MLFLVLRADEVLEYEWQLIIMKINLVTSLLILVLSWIVSKVAKIAVHEFRSFPAHNFHTKHLIIAKISKKANQNIWMEISNYMYTTYFVYSFTTPFCDATMHTGIHNIIYTWLMNNCNWGTSFSLTCQGFFRTCNATIPCQLCSYFLHIKSKHDPQMTELVWVSLGPLARKKALFTLYV